MAHVRKVLNPVARPVDLYQAQNGNIYILEYSREVDHGGFALNMPGRLLELSLVK